MSKEQFINERAKYLRQLIGALQLSDNASEITYNYAAKELAKIYDGGVL